MQVFRLALIGALIYLAAQEVLLGRALKERRLRYLVGLWLINAAVFVGLRYAQHEATTAAALVWSVKGQLGSTFAMGPIGLLLVHAICLRPLDRLAKGFLAVTSVVCLLPWVDGWLVLGNEARATVDMLGQRYLNAQPGPLHVAIAPYATLIAAYAFVLARQARYADRDAMIPSVGPGERQRLATIARLSVAVLIVASLNDALLFSGRLQTTQMLEVAFGLQGLLVMFGMVRRVGRIQGSLETAVKARTAELGAKTEELSRTADRLSTLVSALPDPVIAVRRGDVVFANRAAEAWLGFGDGDLLGQPFARRATPETRDALGDALESLEAGRSTVVPRSVELFREDGKKVVGEVGGLPVQLDGEPATVLILHDRTDRVAMQRQLAAADRLAQLGRLAAGIAHEINNPLGYVTANLEELRADPDSAARGEMLDDALDGARRIRMIVRDLRAFSRPARDDEQRGDVVEALEAAAKIAGNQVRHRGKLTRDFEDGLPKVRGDSRRLTQVFVNLVINAAQALPGGDADRHRIQLEAKAEPPYIVARVRDTGTGIDAETLQRVFDPFYTTKPEVGGTGLGLSICHAIVTGFGGEIAIDSELGKGTTVTVRLLIDAGEERASATPTAVPVAAKGRPLRVLVVDDEPAITRALRRMLRDEDVTTCNDGATCLALCEEQTFDVILCDLMMPQVSGPEVYEALAKRGDGLEERMVFITGGAFSDDVRGFLAEVPNVVLDKPIERAVLLAALRENGNGHSPDESKRQAS